MVFIHDIRGLFPRNPPIHRPPLVTPNHTTPPPQSIALRSTGETHDMVCILSLHCYPERSPLPRLETHEMISPSNPPEDCEDIPLWSTPSWKQSDCLTIVKAVITDHDLRRGKKGQLTSGWRLLSVLLAWLWPSCPLGDTSGSGIDSSLGVGGTFHKREERKRSLTPRRQGNTTLTGSSHTPS